MMFEFLQFGFAGIAFFMIAYLMYAAWTKKDD